MPKSVECEVIHSVGLTIWGVEFDPREVTQGLGMRPSKAWRKGEPKWHVGRDGIRRQFTSVYEWSGWTKWPSDRVTRVSLERQLSRWVAKLRPKIGVLRALRRRGISMELDCCIIASRSIRTQLPADLVASIGRLGLDVEITWYAPLKKRSNKRLRPSAAGRRESGRG